jgi:hypothetical protein
MSSRRSSVASRAHDRDGRAHERDDDQPEAGRGPIFSKAGRLLWSSRSLSRARYPLNRCATLWKRRATRPHANRAQRTTITTSLAEPQDTPEQRTMRAVAERAAISLAPPLLVLWFGWDVWFAVVGLMSPCRRNDNASAVAESPPTKDLAASDGCRPGPKPLSSPVPFPELVEPSPDVGSRPH